MIFGYSENHEHMPLAGRVSRRYYR